MNQRNTQLLQNDEISRSFQPPNVFRTDGYGRFPFAIGRVIRTQAHVEHNQKPIDDAVAFGRYGANFSSNDFKRK